MATSMGADSIRFAASQLPDWQIRPGATCPLIEIHVADALTTYDLIELGGPGRVRCIDSQTG
jgi:hypothetical protein